MFTSPRLNSEGLRCLYNADYETSSSSAEYCSREHATAPEYAAVCDYVQRYVPRHGRVLDAGCGEGNLLARLDASNGYELEGIEFSTVAAQRAIDRGFRVTSGDFLELDLEPNRYDGLTMMYVLEHVPAPLGVLRKAFDALRPGGHLIIAVPNYNYLRWIYVGPACYARHRQWTALMAAEHLHNFTPRTLSLLARRAGFEIVQWGTAAPHPVGSRLIRLAKSGAWVLSRVLFAVGIHVGGIHAVLRKPAR